MLINPPSPPLLRWRAGMRALARSHLRAVLVLLVVGLCAFLPGQFALQPMDRDEPRFAQASKQMLESGDFIDIRFQQEARHKKPVGIYWAQAASVSIAQALGVADARERIGFYRLPSLLGAIGMALATYWAGLALLSRQGALLAGLAMMTTLVLLGEARLAKTDALLGALSALGLGFFLRAYLSARARDVFPPLSAHSLPLFWGVVGLAVLIKGPLLPLVMALCTVVLWVRDRDARWFGQMRPFKGLVLVALIVLPWLFLILLKSGNAFLEASVGQDMLAKIGGAQEKHGAPPGAYLATFWLVFWPLAPFVLLVAPFAWKERRDDGVALLLAWFVPFWLILEAVPTKLPHYPLPAYPALALLVLLAAERGAWATARWLHWLAAFLLVLVPLALLLIVPGVFLLLGEGRLEGRVPWLALPFLLSGLALALLGARALVVRPRPVRALAFGIAAALALTPGVLAFGLPKLEALRLSPRLAQAVKAQALAAQCATLEVASAGYHEPSLVFLVGTSLRLTNGHHAGAFLAEGAQLRAPHSAKACRIALVERAHEEAFLSQYPAEAALRLRGVNLNAAIDKTGRLRVLDLGVYVQRP